MTRARSLLLSSFFFGIWLATSTAAADPTKRECVSANETGQDLRRGGRLREARASFAVCTAESCPSAVREDCGQRLKDVEAALPTVVLEAKDTAGHDLSNVRVTMDGEALRDKLNGAATAVDPGEHHFVFEAEGLRRSEQAVVVREGEHNRAVAATLESMVAPVTTEGKESHWIDPGTQRALGLAVGASGAAAVVVGAIFGFISKSTYDRAKSECAVSSPPTGCTPQAMQDRQSAVGQATVATIAIAGGGVLFAGGAVLYLTAPKEESVAIGPTFENGGGGLSLRGRW
jgi:hypothetical protein